MSDFEKLKLQLDQYGQSHLLKFWDEITEDQRQTFLNQLKTINLKEVVGYFKTANESLGKDVEKLDDKMEPLPKENYDSSEEVGEEELEMYRREGLEKIANGEVRKY